MTPELQKQLADMLARLTDATAGASTWAQAQAGPLVQEKIAFGRAFETFDLLMAVALFALFAFLAHRSWRMAKEDDFDSPGWIVGGVASLIGVVVMFFAIDESMRSFLMVWFAPRLYVVEWLKAMVTK